MASARWRHNHSLFLARLPDALLGFGFGGTLLALFMRGSILPRLQTRRTGGRWNGIPAMTREIRGVRPGVITSDCAGMAADIFESYRTIVSGLILGLALWHITGQLEWIIFPLMVRGIGVLSSIIGTYFVKAGKTGKSVDAMAAIFSGFLTSAVISAALFFIAGFFYLNTPEMNQWGGWWRVWLWAGVCRNCDRPIDRIFHRYTCLQ
jgi:K(+)-stimulated pyrophosphate-energized sodium pump